MTQIIIFMCMLNIIGFSFYAGAESNPFSRRKQNIVNFLCPIGSLLGILVFRYSFKEESKSITFGIIFSTSLVFATMISLSLAI